MSRRAPRGARWLISIASLALVVTGHPNGDRSFGAAPLPSQSESPPADRVSSAPWYPSRGAYFGAAVQARQDTVPPVCLSPDKQLALLAFQRCVGTNVLLDRVYHRWDGSGTPEGWPTQYDRWSRDSGHRLFVSWRPVMQDGSIVPWADISAGRQDAWIDATARRVKEFGARIYLSFDAEPEQEVRLGLGTPTDFRAAWTRIVQRFRLAGVRNVNWVLVLMGYTFSPASGRNPLDWYPGRAYVDAVGVDSYNWFGCNGGPATWRPFGALFETAYRWLLARGMPMAIGEWGTVEDPADPARKPLWIAGAAGWLKTHPNVKSVMYFDERDTIPGHRDCDWTVDTTSVSLAAFGRLTRDPYFRAGFGTP